MLDKLSDSELEKCDLNLDAFMKEDVEIFENPKVSNGLLND